MFPIDLLQTSSQKGSSWLTFTAVRDPDNSVCFYPPGSHLFDPISFPLAADAQHRLLEKVDIGASSSASGIRPCIQPDHFEGILTMLILLENCFLFSTGQGRTNPIFKKELDSMTEYYWDNKVDYLRNTRGLYYNDGSCMRRTGPERAKTETSALSCLYT